MLIKLNKLPSKIIDAIWSEQILNAKKILNTMTRRIFERFKR